jgi:hypothetical protein
MDNETGKNENRTESVTNSQTKQPWHSPAIEELDLAETQAGGFAAGDGGGLAIS